MKHVTREELSHLIARHRGYDWNTNPEGGFDVTWKRMPVAFGTDDVWQHIPDPIREYEAMMDLVNVLNACGWLVAIRSIPADTPFIYHETKVMTRAFASASFTRMESQADIRQRIRFHPLAFHNDLRICVGLVYLWIFTEEQHVCLEDGIAP